MFLVLALTLPDHMLAEPVGREAGTPPARRNDVLWNVQQDSALVGAADTNRRDHREAVRSHPAKQHVRQSSQPPRCPGVVDPGRGTAAGWPLGRGRCRRQRRTVNLRLAAARQIRPDDESPGGHFDLDA